MNKQLAILVLTATPRWTAYEAERYGVELPEYVPMVNQERVYTSPIWSTRDK